MATPRPRCIAHVFLLVLVTACSSSDFPDREKSAPLGSECNGSSAGPDRGSLAFKGPTMSSDCPEAAKLLYVFSTEGDLYSFQPKKKLFTNIGHIGCTGDPTFRPNSMAVDRTGMAWVQYLSQNPVAPSMLIEVSTADASCTAAFVVSNLAGRVGMGFSTDAPGGSAETLFVSSLDAPPSGLARIDLASHAMLAIAPLPDALSCAQMELTGTGDGRLFGFAPLPGLLVELDKSDASIIAHRKVLPTADADPNRLSWAFSAWGGDFYLYTNDRVTRYDPATGAIDAEYMTKIGFDIVGAGASTCAPTHNPG